jgi:hypothetical protein
MSLVQRPDEDREAHFRIVAVGPWIVGLARHPLLDHMDPLVYDRNMMEDMIGDMIGEEDRMTVGKDQPDMAHSALDLLQDDLNLVEGSREEVELK